jgi:hypothetical protein
MKEAKIKQLMADLEKAKGSKRSAASKSPTFQSPKKKNPRQTMRKFSRLPFSPPRPLQAIDTNVEEGNVYKKKYKPRRR